MKKPLKPKTRLLLFNLPVFVPILLVIFLKSQWLVHAIPFVALFSLLTICLIHFTPTPNITKKITFKNIFLICAIPIFFFILLITPAHYLPYIQPNYPSFAALDYIPMLVITGTLLTVIFAKIINHYFYDTHMTGTIYNSLEEYFGPRPNLIIGLQMLVALTIQTTIAFYLVINILICSYVILSLLHYSFYTGVSIPLLILFYGFILLPKIPFFSKVIRFLNEHHWRSGHLYLLGSTFAIVTLILVNLILNNLPPSLSNSIIHAYHIQLESLSNTHVWIIMLTAAVINLSLLLASLLVRLQRNINTYYNIPIVIVISIILYGLSRASINIQLSQTFFILCALTQGIIIIMVCLYMTGNQMSLIGFLFNKNQSKYHIPVGHIVPTIQSFFIFTVMFCVAGSYGLLFSVYIGAMPFIIIALVSTYMFIYLRYKTRYEKPCHE